MLIDFFFAEDTEILSIHPYSAGLHRVLEPIAAFERGDVYTQFIAGPTYKGTQSFAATLSIYLTLFKVANLPI